MYLEGKISPAAYFGDLTRWENVLHEVLNALTTWIGDFLVVSPPALRLLPPLLKTSEDLSMPYYMEQQYSHYHYSSMSSVPKCW